MAAVCVFCASSSTLEQRWLDLAYATGREIAKVEGPGSAILAVAYAHSGKFLVSDPEHTSPKRARAYLLTDHEAPMRRVVRVDLDAFVSTGAFDLVDVLPEGFTQLPTE